MTDEELDKARAAEAKRRYFSQSGYTPTASLIAARLAREGWMPTDFDPDLVEARECAGLASYAEGETLAADKYREGAWDTSCAVQSALIAIKRMKEKAS